MIGSLIFGSIQRRLNDTIIGLAFLYAKFKHLTLAVILQPYITGNATHHVARRAALMIARACATTELQPESLEITFDEVEDYIAREAKRSGRFRRAVRL